MKVLGRINENGFVLITFLNYGFLIIQVIN